MNKENRKGFTLLELLIVVVIISILAIAVLFVLNPAETLKKSRDAQRFADLGTLKNTIAIYITTKPTAYIGGASTNSTCKTGTGGGSYIAGSKIFYSTHNDQITLTDGTLDGGTSSLPGPGQSATAQSNALVDGNGWIPVDLASISGGSPISNLPVDPINTISSASAIANTDKVYRYACNATEMTFEIDAVLESSAFTVEDDRRVKDGGNNSNYYEVGTNVQILGTGTDF